MTDKEWLSAKVDTISNAALKKACARLLRDSRFFVAPAAAKKHQAHTGGLAEHTKEVMDIAISMSMAECLKGKVSTDVIIAAVLWHDYGKIWDYKLNVKSGIMDDGSPLLDEGGNPIPEWVYERHRWTIRHLSRSHAEFHRAASECGVSEDLIEEVSHAILAHHGRNEWGSPITPMSTEASIVHFADSIDAFHVGKPHPFRDANEDSDWKTPGGR